IDEHLAARFAAKEAALKAIGTGAAVLFKGSGFYETDYRSESYKKASKAEKDGGSDKGTSEKAASDKGTSGKAGSTSKDGASSGASKASVAESKPSKPRSPKSSDG
ncbi:MAG: 4'-phosphopantetheinyl transferase superfamily protein, partial [Phycisphaerales bacterium]|nr:4'-phosphopantetheinyl transferase superfamily protein [Phycisphaerales bacterium]